MATLVIQTDNKEFLTSMQNMYLSTEIQGQTWIFERIFGWWTEDDCKQVIIEWINEEDYDGRYAILEKLGGIDAAANELADRANQCFDANDGINWSYLQAIWGMIVKRAMVKDRG